MLWAVRWPSGERPLPDDASDGTVAVKIAAIELNRQNHLAQRAEGKAESISYRGFDHADDSHFSSRCPPRTQCDQRFHRADDEMRDNANRKRSYYSRDSSHEEKWHDWDKGADRGGDCR